MAASPALEPRAWLRGHRAQVSAVCFLFGGRERLASGDVEGTVLVWSLHSKRVIKVHEECHPGGVLHIVACSEDNRWVSQGRADGCVKIWRGDDLDDIIRTESESFCRASVLWRDNGFIMACTPHQETVLKIWGLEEEPVLLSPPTGETWGMIMDAHLLAHNDSTFASVAYEDGCVRWFDVNEKQYLMDSTIRAQPEPNPTTSLIVSRVNNNVIRVIAGGSTSNLCVATYSVEGSSLLQKTVKTVLAYYEDGAKNTAKDPEEGKFGKGVSQMALRKDERILAIGSWDHRVRIMHFRTEKHLAVLKGHRDSVQCVAFSDDSTLLASGSRDQNIAIWEIYPPTAE